jgi:hypothetical protein
VSTFSLGLNRPVKKSCEAQHQAQPMFRLQAATGLSNLSYPGAKCAPVTPKSQLCQNPAYTKATAYDMQ